MSYFDPEPWEDWLESLPRWQQALFGALSIGLTLAVVATIVGWM